MPRVPVELVEDDDDHVSPQVGAGPPGVAAWLRAHPRVVAGAAAVVVLVAGTSVAADRLHDARLDARYAAAERLDGTVHRVAPPQRTVLTLDGPDAHAVQRSVAVAGRFVGAAPDTTGTWVRALDAASGAEAWRTPVDLPAVPATLPAGFSPPVDDRVEAGCRRLDGTDVACAVRRTVGEIAVSDGDGSEAVATVDAVAVVRVDGRDGTVLDRRDEGVATVVLGADASWVATPDADGGGWTVAERAPDTTERWRRHVTLPAGSPGDPLQVRGSDDVVALSHGGRVVVLDRADGAILGAFGPGSGKPAELVVRGRAVVGSWIRSYGTGSASWLWTPGRSAPLTGESFVHLDVDDGSLDGVVLSAETGGRQTGTLTARDVDGRVLWRSSAASDGVALLLDGRLVTHADGIVTAVDPDDGHVLWTSSTPVRPTFSSGILTDGVDVLLVEGDTIVALDLRSGREHWTAHAVVDELAERARLVPGPEPTTTPSGIVADVAPTAGAWTRTPDGRLAYWPRTRSGVDRLLVLG